MKASETVRGHWKLIVNAVTFLALALLIWASRHQLLETFGNLFKVNAWALLLLIPIEALNYHAQTKLYQGLFAKIGNKLSYRFLYRASLELNFVNHVFPSGGVTGISYFGARLRDGSTISGSKATLVQIMKLVLTFLSLEVLLVIGLVCLAVFNMANALLVMLVTVFLTLAVVITLALSIIVGSQHRINVTFTFLTRLLNKIIQVVRPLHPETISISKAKAAISEFHQNYHQLRSSPRQLLSPFWWALVANATEIGAIYAVYIAFGQIVNIGAVILAYAVANVAGLISVLPGGVGIFEALMTAVLASAGIPAGVSLPVTVMYRVLNTIIQVPPGYFLYHQAIKANGLGKRLEAQT